MITNDNLLRWLDAYGAAWTNKDASAVASLFTEDALYQETPYADPFPGRAGISEYWSRVTADQDDIDFSFEALGVRGTRGFAQWSARFRLVSQNTQVELNGVFVLDFADADHVSSLREWWHAR
jgi:ketosteroid isomerase-like protein